MENADRAPAPAPRAPSGDEDEGFEPEFTVYLVRRGKQWPMVIDSVFIAQELAAKRVAMMPVSQGWSVQEYSHMRAKAAVPGDPPRGRPAEEQP